VTEIVIFVLDTTTGRPAAGVPVELQSAETAGGWTTLAAGVTDESGCIPGLARDIQALPAGRYRLRYDTTTYFAARDVKSIYPEIVVNLTLGNHRRYVVPLLLSPFGYTTYRGS